MVSCTLMGIQDETNQCSMIVDVKQSHSSIQHIASALYFFFDCVSGFQEVFACLISSAWRACGVSLIYRKCKAVIISALLSIKE